MTIIFSKRDDTLFLQNIWKGLSNINLIEITDSYFGRMAVWDALNAEKDIVIMCGHGDFEGLLAPNFRQYIIHLFHANCLKNKTVICIWCNASDFVKKWNLHGFATSMFISDVNEAYDYNFHPSEESIEKENELFANRINNLLLNKTNINQWCSILQNEADMSKDFVKFNYNGLITN